MEPILSARFILGSLKLFIETLVLTTQSGSVRVWVPGWEGINLYTVADIE